ncbi:MAG: hypothetical protein U0174_27825 [Polyangiaceae bacterium]
MSSARTRIAFSVVLAGALLLAIVTCADSPLTPLPRLAERNRVAGVRTAEQRAKRTHPLWFPEDCLENAEQRGRDPLHAEIAVLTARNYRIMFGTDACCCSAGIAHAGDLDGDGHDDAVAALGCSDPSTGTDVQVGFAVFRGTKGGGLALVSVRRPDARFEALSICGDEVWVGYRSQRPEDPFFDLPAGPNATVVQRFRLLSGALRRSPEKNDTADEDLSSPRGLR